MGASLSSHTQRFITAAVIIPCLFAYIFWGGPLLFALLGLGRFMLGTYEYLTLDRGGTALRGDRPAGVLGTLALGWRLFFRTGGPFRRLIFNFFILVIYLILTFKESGLFFDRLGKQLFALWYLPLFLPFFILLRSGPQGRTGFFFCWR